ncbi:MAG TPA: hypothetical protein VF506_06490 [Streptosporangiaceae bacterium]
MSSAALLVMDVQEAIVRRFGDDPGYLERMDLAISAAREARIPVVYVVVGFRSGHPEVSSRNKTFTAPAALSFGSKVATFTCSGSTPSTARLCSTSSPIFVSSAREARSGSQPGRAS